MTALRKAFRHRDWPELGRQRKVAQLPLSTAVDGAPTHLRFVAIPRQRTLLRPRLTYAATGDGSMGLVMRRRFPGGHIGPNRYPHCKVSDSGHLCFWDAKLAMWVPMFRLTNAQLFEWMKSIKVLDAELR
jgi:hypothetical protein